MRQCERRARVMGRLCWGVVLMVGCAGGCTRKSPERLSDTKAREEAPVTLADVRDAPLRPDAGAGRPAPPPRGSSPAADAAPAGTTSRASPRRSPLRGQAPNRQRPCPTHKLSFTRRSGCTNDGSVELCVPKRDRALLRRLLRIAPSLRRSGGRGRARCDLGTEVLYFFPTPRRDPAICGKGGLTASAWRRLCALASLPRIRRIVPTFFE